MEAKTMRVSKTIEVEIPNLGQRIKDARMNVHRSKSLLSLCDEAGIRTTYWYKIEKEENKVLPIETLRRIEKALGVDFGVEV